MFSCNRVRVMVPSYRNAVINDKNFTVYRIEVIFNGNVRTLEKRYSEFYEVYRKLQKIVLTKIAFPPKKMLNKDEKIIENRRKGLEFYLQEILHEVQDEIPEKLLKFLEIEDIIDDLSDGESLNENSDVDEVDKANFHNSQHHQTMMCFETNAFFHSSAQEILEEQLLPDIVLKGCLDGIY